DIAPPATWMTPVTKANNDFFQSTHDTQATLAALANDTDSRGLPLSIFFPGTNVVTSHGLLGISSDAKNLGYTPSGGFSGVDTFMYGMVNDFSQESSAKLTVSVNQANNTAPVAASWTDHIGTSTSVSINLFTGCTDANGDSLQLYAVNQPQFGS